MDTCPRCAGPMLAFTGSMFNTQTICLDCKQDEQGAPGYEAARAAELAAVQAGNRNFAGVGLSASDLAYLAAQRAQRQAAR